MNLAPASDTLPTFRESNPVDVTSSTSDFYEGLPRLSSCSFPLTI
jgi:hypothetical protein